MHGMGRWLVELEDIVLQLANGVQYRPALAL
jgi:hypothetical protein